MTWERTAEEWPPNICRRCDVAYYADEDANPEDREHWVSPLRSARGGGTVHIKRINVTAGMRPYTRAAMALADGKPVTYCGLEIVVDAAGLRTRP